MKKVSSYILVFLMTMFIFNGVVNAEEFYFCNNESINAFKVIGNIIVVVKIAVPVIIIVFGMIDFARAVISNDEKAVSVSAKALIRRLIAGIVVFFIPTLTLAILEVVTPDEKKIATEGVLSSCTTCMLKPSKCDDLQKSLPGPTK